MRTNALMSSSALFMACVGLAATFFPHELVVRFDPLAQGFAVLVVQITGALYLGFAILNWTARRSVIGGIYNRPIALGNFLHFLMVFLVLLGGAAWRMGLLALAFTLLYALFAVWFGVVLFTSPRQASAS